MLHSVHNPRIGHVAFNLTVCFQLVQVSLGYVKARHDADLEFSVIQLLDAKH